MTKGLWFLNNTIYDLFFFGDARLKVFQLRFFFFSFFSLLYFVLYLIPF